MGCNVIKHGCISILLSLWSLDIIDIHKMIIYNIILTAGDALALDNGGVVDDYVGRCIICI